MAQSKGKARYSKPASQVDLEARLENENKSSRVLSTSDNFEASEDDGNAREFAVEDNEREGYIGVDPVYQTYANETEKPLTAEGGADAAVAKGFLPSKGRKKSGDSQASPSGPPAPEQKDKQ